MNKWFKLVLFIIAIGIFFDILSVIIYSLFGITANNGMAMTMTGGIAGALVFSEKETSTKK